MEIRLGKLFLLAMIVLGLGLSSRAQAPEEFWNHGVEKLANRKSTFYVPSPEREIMKRRWDEIGESLASSNTSFEGTYAQLGYDTGYLLRFSREKGFILIPYFDQSMILDFSYGSVEITDNSEVVLIPEKELDANGLGLKKTPDKWIPVMNSDFIVPAREIRFFGIFYGGFGMYNGFPRNIPCDGCGTFFFAKRLDEREGKAVENFLAPAKYLKYIRKPITAAITYVGKKKFAKADNQINGLGELSSVTPVRINVGKRQGVKNGYMFLLIDSGDNFDQILKITKVNSLSSTGVVIRTVDKNRIEVYDGEYDKKLGEYEKITYPPLRIGTRVTTSSVVN